MPETLQLSCPCGEVGLAVTGQPRVQLYCHCDDCQAVHGAACVPAALYLAADVQITRGETLRWQLKTTPRVCCARCGARLFADNTAIGIRGLTATLLPEGMFKPTMHIQCAFARLPIRDGLPHYKTVPAAFGGSDEQIAW